MKQCWAKDESATVKTECLRIVSPLGKNIDSPEFQSQLAGMADDLQKFGRGASQLKINKKEKR
jgi:hypothetical protein